LINFPGEYTSYLSGVEADKSFDKSIYALADHRATQYIDFNKDASEEDVKMRVIFLKYLLWTVRYVDPDKYISSGEIIGALSDLFNTGVRREYLFREIIAPLRDADIIIASCSQGYKIPTCIDDVYLYINQTTGVVGPMLSRIENSRQLILAQTDGAFDILDDPALKKYKRYFGD
jgi:hypothetical protein